MQGETRCIVALSHTGMKVNEVLSNRISNLPARCFEILFKDKLLYTMYLNPRRRRDTIMVGGSMDKEGKNTPFYEERRRTTAIGSAVHVFFTLYGPAFAGSTSISVIDAIQLMTRLGLGTSTFEAAAADMGWPADDINPEE